MDCDVLIIGGGVAGVSAAIASAEEGAKVVLLEKLGWLGGMVTGAYVIALCGCFDGHLGKNRTVRGNFDKIVNRAIKEGAAKWTKWNRNVPSRKGREVTVDPEGFKYVLDRMVIEAGVDLRLHTHTFGDYPFASINIDCTGDGLYGRTLSIPPGHDTAITMGVRIGGIDTSKTQYDKDNPPPRIKVDEHQFSACGWMSVLNEKGERFYDCMGLKSCYRLDNTSLTKAETEGRRVAHKFIEEIRQYPGYEKAYLISTGPTLGNRKAKAMVTRYYLTDEDQNRWFDDSIAVAGNVMKDYGYMEIPYRCLLSKSDGHLLYAGRTFTPQCIESAHREGRNFIAYEIPRLVAPCIATGEAAGVAAAMCADQGRGCDNVDVSELQERLKTRGAIYHV